MVSSITDWSVQPPCDDSAAGFGFYIPEDELGWITPPQECPNQSRPISPKQEEFPQTFSTAADYAQQSQLVSIEKEEYSQAVPEETDLDRVRNFFEYSLPPFVEHRHHSTSTSTRPPARFDRHLDDNLRLKRIIYQPSLIADLEAIADQALEDYISIRPLPPTAVKKTLFPDREAREQDLQQSVHSRLINERSVEDVYLRTLARECGIIACTLEFQLPVWSASYLQWTTQYRSDENYAIADGFLELVATPVPELDEEQPPPLPEVYSQVTEDFPVLGAWEFKSLRVGSIEVFKAILELARRGDFPWQGCDAGNQTLCALQHAPHTHTPLKTWSKMGPDASQSVFKSVLLPPEDRPVPPLPSENITDMHLTHGIHIVQQGFSEMVKHDTTLGCLNAGRYEIYFGRHRAQNAIYITDVILTDSPGRARALTGFFIAVIRDAKERSRLLRRTRCSVRTWCPINPYENLHIISVLLSEEILAEALTRPLLSLVPDEKKSLPSSFLPNSPYLRVSSAAMAGTQDTSISDAFVEIAIPPQAHTSKGILKISGNTFEGITGRFSRFVVVKTANQKRINQRLEHEYQVYLDLAAAGVTCIPDVIGLFSRANSEDTPHIKLHYLALVLEDVGRKSLAEIWEQEGKISRKLLLECQEALKQIHAAGYCYGTEFSLHDIIVREEELERSDRSRVSFVSFGGAHRVTQEWWWKHAELQGLVRFLQNPRKRGLEDEVPDDHSIPNVTPQKSGIMSINCKGTADFATEACHVPEATQLRQGQAKGNRRKTRSVSVGGNATRGT